MKLSTLHLIHYTDSHCSTTMMSIGISIANRISMRKSSTEISKFITGESFHVDRLANKLRYNHEQEKHI